IANSSGTPNPAIAIGSNASAAAGGTAIGDFTSADGQGVAIGNAGTAASATAIAIGAVAQASGSGSVAVGVLSTGSGSQSVAVGSHARGTGPSSTALGANTLATNSGDVALGLGSTTSVAVGTSSVTIDGITYSGFAGTTPGANVSIGGGFPISTRTLTNVAAGRISQASTDAINGSQLYSVADSLSTQIADTETHYYSVNDGGTQGGNFNNDGATGLDSMAAGVGASAHNSGDIAMGANAYSFSGTSGLGNVAIGQNASANDSSGGNGVTALGSGAQAGTGGFTGATALGANSTATQNSTAVGFNSVANNTGSALGNGAQATGIDTVAIGTATKASGNFDTSIGWSATASGGSSFAGGRRAKASGISATALGDTAIASGQDSVAVGVFAGASGSNSVAIGLNTRVSGTSSGAFGPGSSVVGNYSAAVGTGNNISANNAFVLGSGVTIAAGLDGAVALGNASVVAASNPTASTIINGTTYNFAGAAPAAGSVVSVGSAGNERQITNVAAGQLNAGSTDAVNGSQLYATNQAVEAVSTVANAGWNVTTAATGSGVANGTSVGNVGPGGTATITADNNVITTQTGTTVAIGVNPVLTGLTSIAFTGGGPTLSAVGIDMGGTKITNLANGTNPDDAVNLSQLDSAVAGATTHYYSVNDGGTQGGNYNNDGATGAGALAAGVDASAVGDGSTALGQGAVANNADDVALGAGSVTAAANPTASAVIGGTTYVFAGGAPTSVVSVGSAGNERQVTNVAAGRVSATSTDAVNGSQLYATNQAVGGIQ